MSPSYRPTPRRCLWAALLCLLTASLTAPPVRAQAAPALTVLHDFGDGAGGGISSAPVLALGDGFLYGTAQKGGANEVGTLFKVKADGTGYTVLHDFGGGLDGNYPMAALAAPGDGFLYGTTYSGGANAAGTLFKVRPDGTGYAVLYAFGSSAGGPDGGNSPNDALIAPGDGFLYGTAQLGGANGTGAVFKVKTDGTGYAVLHAFSAQSDSGDNSDGANPKAALIAPGDGFLYGTAFNGGANGKGTLFKVRPDGTGYAVLHAFSAAVPSTDANADGVNPQAALVAPGDGSLYGTTYAGGTNGAGAVFKVRADGTGFTVLHAFSAADPGTGANADGAYPQAALISGGDGFLYGTAYDGGAHGAGALFKVGTDGTGFTTLYAFSAFDGRGNNADGRNPKAALAAPGDGYLYGTAFTGGAGGYGTVFRLSGGPVGTSPPPVTLTHLLWDNPDGKAAFWNVNADGSVPSAVGYGPFADGQSLWHATALATGPDGLSHILWNNADGKVALWTVNDAGSITATVGFGPYTENGGLWKAVSLSVGPDNVTHLLWTNPDHRAAFWNVQLGGAYAGLAAYGPFTDGAAQNVWDAAGVSTGPDNVSHLVWRNADGKAAFWAVSNADGSATGLAGYGPFTDGPANSLWEAIGVSTGPDNVSHLLWSNPDGKAAFWDVGSASGSVSAYAGYGPFTDGAAQSLWSATALATGPDNVSRLLWNNADGKVALWTLSGSGALASATGYGPFTDGSAQNTWSAVGVSAGP